eukprot:765692-Hanusia_phi.AAC.2
MVVLPSSQRLCPMPLVVRSQHSLLLGRRHIHTALDVPALPPQMLLDSLLRAPEHVVALAAQVPRRGLASLQH